MGFTVEEINLMCIYDTSSRNRLIVEMRESLPDIYEPELLELTKGMIGRLEAMPDTEFAALDLIPADEYDEEMEA